MNWVLILVIVILGGYTIAGYTKGFLKIVYSLISWLLILVFVTWATPHINDYLKNNMGLYDKVLTYCEESIRERTMEQMENGDVSSSNLSALTENELLAELLDKLPVEAIEKIMQESADAANGYLEEQGVYTNLASGMADLVLEGISFIIALILGGIASALLVQILGFISHLPLIGFANSICGLFAGAVNGLLIVWVAFCLVGLLGTTEIGSKVLTQIYANEFLVLLYENNILASLLM